MKKPSIKKVVARKAAKATAKHTARGAAAKLMRKPLRAVTLLSVGVAAGWFLGRRSRVEPQPSA